MDKKVAKRKIALSAARQGLKVQMRAGKTADDIRIINKTGKVVAEGTVKLDSSKKGYQTADVVKVVNQISTKLNASRKTARRGRLSSSMNCRRDRRKMNASRNEWWREYYDEISREDLGDIIGYGDKEFEEDEAAYARYAGSPVVGYLIAKPEYEDALSQESFDMPALLQDGTVCILMGNRVYDVYEGDVRDLVEEDDEDDYDLDSSRRKLKASRRRKMNAGCHGKKKLNAEDDVDTDKYVGDDAEFVDDVESIVTDEAGNEIVVDEMLVVQNPDTNEISLFVPTEEDDQVPENVEVIGEVVSSDSEAVLDSSRKLIASRKKNKMNASAGSDLSEVASALATAFPRTKVTLAVIAESPEGPVTIVKNGNRYNCKAPGFSPENWDSVEEVIDFLGDNYILG